MDNKETGMEFFDRKVVPIETTQDRQDGYPENHSKGIAGLRVALANQEGLFN